MPQFPAARPFSLCKNPIPVFGGARTCLATPHRLIELAHPQKPVAPREGWLRSAKQREKA
jgi:hypothetical protein